MSRSTLATLALLAACAAPDDVGIEVRLGLSPTPATVGDTRVVVTLSGPEAQAGDLDVSVSGRPAEADSAPGAVPAALEANGDYVVPAFPFDSPGEWIMVVRVEREEVRLVERAFPVRVVGPLRSEPRSR